jgi:hypothetical protein
MEKTESVDIRSLIILAVALANLLLLGVLCWFVHLKEQPLFWRNEGGWPVWLRELVLICFYPLTGVELVLLLVLTWTGCRCVGASRRLMVARIGGLVISWGFFILVIIILAANNLTNLWENRPLHWHGQ